MGFGVSGPQIVEGWYGAPWGNPKERMRDYVAIMRKIFAREGPVAHEGAEISLPYRGPGSIGNGQAAQVDPALRAAAADLARHGREGDGDPDRRDRDGWLPSAAPGNVKDVQGMARGGLPARGRRQGYRDFEIQGGVSVAITDDVKSALAAGKPFVALYVGGMGHPKLNFHKKRMEREGWGEAANRIHELFQAGRRDEAIAAVPDDYIDEGGLYGRSRGSASAGASTGRTCPTRASRCARSRTRRTSWMAELVGPRR